MHDGRRRHSNAKLPMKRPDLKKKLVVVGDGGCGKVSQVSGVWDRYYVHGVQHIL